MLGMALGDIIGAHVEFRPREYLRQYPVTELKGGGTWGLKKGQFTDDTSMALCLASSLIARQDYVPYDQLVRYKWWYKHGYMSSTGSCFDIGAATKQSLMEFERRQNEFAKKHNIPLNELDFLSDPELLKEFEENCSEEGAAGNGALMRLAPVPLFFRRHPKYAVEYSGLSGLITHGDEKVYDACRYYSALIVAAVNKEPKEELLDENFYEKHKQWFAGKSLHPDIERIAQGSYRKQEGYDKGIRGKGYIVNALEAALWAFWSDQGSFENGVLAAVNLGDDTDTTAAIYGQLAGACYGSGELRKDWVEQVYAKDFIECLSKWIVYEGKKWSPKQQVVQKIPYVTIQPPLEDDNASSLVQKKNLFGRRASKSPTEQLNSQSNFFSKFEQFTGLNANHRLRANTVIDRPSNLKSGSEAQFVSTRPKSAEHHPSKQMMGQVFISNRFFSVIFVSKLLLT
ncbi:unnamed protein product [Rotaria sordida]|nr:unnamed protein product [Rotaria sordida]CAF3870958.1 unnamed protein product [Rotaria sordida]